MKEDGNRYYLKRACESFIASSDDVKEDERFKLPRLYATQIVDLLDEDDDIVGNYYNNVLHCLYYYCGPGAPKQVDAARIDNWLSKVVVSNLYNGTPLRFFSCSDSCYNRHIKYVCAYRGFKSKYLGLTEGCSIEVDDNADESTWAYKYKHGEYGSKEILLVRRIIDHVSYHLEMPTSVNDIPISEIDKDFTVRQRVKKDLWEYFGIVLDLETGIARKDLKEHGRVLCEFLKRN